MYEGRPKTSTVLSARALLKRIPGLVTFIHRLRALWRESTIAVIAHGVAWGRKTPQRRRLIFSALREPLAIAVHPQESYIVNPTDKVIGGSLYAAGQFDFQKFQTACRLISVHAGLAPDAVLPDTVLIDAGANIGSICIPAVKRGLVSRAIAFELDPDNVRLLKVNALLNGVDDRIDIRNLAVGAASGQVSIQRSAANFGDHRVLMTERASGIAIDMIPLDSIADHLDLRKTILWMDVQGYEAYALQGAGRFMEAGVPLITEFSRAELDSFDCFETFLTVITTSGYRIFYDVNAVHPQAVPLSRAALHDLCDRLEQQNTFTDLLFLRGTAA